MQQLNIEMNDFEDFHVLHKALGDFWYSYFGGAEQVGTYVDSVTELCKQVESTMHELTNSLSRHTIDVYRSYRNYPLKVKLSEYNEWSGLLPQYDGSYMFNGQIHYSVPVRTASRVKAPFRIVSIASIANRITEPTIDTEDFTFEDSYITLHFNPFEEDFVVETLPDKDEEVTLWLKDVKLDYDDLYTQYGYALDIKLPSSERYKEIINAYTDCLVNGGSKDNVLKFIKAVTGADGEITDDVKGLALPEGFLGNCMKSVVVINEDVPVEVKEQDGFTRVDLPVMGEDAKKFNDLAFERGKAACVEIIDECELRKIYEQTSVN